MVKSTMKLLVLLISTLTTKCLAKQTKIFNINIINDDVGNKSIRDGHNDNTVSTGRSKSVGDIDNDSRSISDSGSGKEKGKANVIMDRGSINFSGDYGAAIAMERHHTHHQHKVHGQSRHNDPSKSASHKDNFDFYVYSMSYQPEFCRENNEKYDGCRAFNESWEGQLTIHGLWPNNNDGTYPSSCTDEQLDISLLQTLRDSLSNKWPNIKALSSSSPEHDAFWAHEWSKHGTCSGLSQLDYFSSALGMLVPTPSVVKERYGSRGEVTRQELEKGYTYHRYDNDDASKGGLGVAEVDDASSAVILVCKSGYLSEVRVCYEKKSSREGGAVGGVGDRMRCPASVIREDTCGATVKIASFVEMIADKAVLMKE